MLILAPDPAAARALALRLKPGAAIQSVLESAAPIDAPLVDTFWREVLAQTPNPKRRRVKSMSINRDRRHDC